MGTLQSLQLIGFLLCLSATDIKGAEERVPAHARDAWDYGSGVLASCDFNDNLKPFCNWKQSCSSSLGSWIRSRDPTPTLGTGPEGDYPDGKGYYIYQEASNLLPFDTTTLESQELVVSGEICIDFWYHMFGKEDSNELRVVILTDEDEFMLWHRKGGQSSDWLHGYISVHFLREKDIQVGFVVTRGLTEYGDTALDNVAVRSGPCDVSSSTTPPATTPKPTPLFTTPLWTITPTHAPDPSVHCDFSCSFDVDFCFWRQLPSDMFDWKRHKGPTSSADTGPPYDHTSGGGYFIYLQGNAVSPGDATHLASPVCTSRSPRCFSFWYHMYGAAQTMALRVYVVFKGAAPRLIWTRTGNKGNQWHRGEVSVAPREGMQIVLEGKRGEDFRSDVAVDDISMEEGYCPGRTPAPSTLATTSRPATLIAAGTPATTFLRTSTTSAAIRPAPPTTGTLPTTSFRTSNTTIGRAPPTTESPLRPDLSCSFDMDFCSWRQMASNGFNWTWHKGPTHSADTGPSSDHTTGEGYFIYLQGHGAKEGDASRLASPFYTFTRPRCFSFWYHMYGVAQRMALRVYLAFENGSRELIWSHSGNKGDQWHRGKVSMPQGKTAQIIMEGERGEDVRSDVAVDDFSMEEGDCPGLTPAAHTPLPIITTTSSSTAPPATEPSVQCKFSCSFDEGLCSWTQSIFDSFDWVRHKGPTASPGTGPSSDHTSGEGYYMYLEGNQTNSQGVAQLVSSICTPTKPQCLFFWYHMYGTSQKMALRIYVVSGDETPKVIWSRTGNKGDHWQRDEVSVPPGRNLQILLEGVWGENSQSVVAVDDLSIEAGDCPASSIRCDFSCSFDLDFCSWKPLASNVFNWTRHQGPTPSSNTGPSSDHTSGEGHFIYLDGSATNTGDITHLVSPVCNSSRPHCLRFWYHMYGAARTMALRILVVSGGAAPVLLWSQTGNKGDQWHRGEVNVAHGENMQIILEGMRGEDVRSDMAVDDLSLEEGFCPGGTAAASSRQSATNSG